MVPFYFGASDKPLFGGYYPPAGDGLRGHGVLVSAPVAHEHIRTHMAIRQLANRLARDGFHVLKFDYFAVGDSGGQSVDGCVAQWKQDIVTAYHELADISGARDISVVGVRLGASIAVEALGALPGVKALVLWDPVVGGRAYLDALRRAGGGHDHPPFSLGGRKVEEIFGFPFSDEMIHSIHAVNLLENGGKFPCPVHLVLSEERPEYDRFEEKMAAAGGSVSSTIVPEPADWEALKGHDEVLVANAMVHAVGSVLIKEDDQANGLRRGAF